MTDKLILADECIVCTGTKQSEKGALLPCGHTFHFDCVYEWLTRGENGQPCPTCREPLYEHELRVIQLDGSGSIPALETDKIALEEENGTLRANLGALREEKASLLAQMKELKTRVEKLEKELEEKLALREDTIKIFTEDIHEMQAALEEVGKKNSSLMRTNGALCSRVKELEKEWKAKEVEILKLRAKGQEFQTAALRAQVEKLETVAREKASLHAKHVDSLFSMTLKNNELTRKLEEAEKGREAAEALIRALKEREGDGEPGKEEEEVPEVHGI